MVKMLKKPSTVEGFALFLLFKASISSFFFESNAVFLAIFTPGAVARPRIRGA